MLNADGYNDKLAVLLEVVVKRMKELKVDKKRFDIIVDQVRSPGPFLIVGEEEVTDIV